MKLGITNGNVKIFVLYKLFQMYPFQDNICLTCFLFRKCYESILFEAVPPSASNAAWAGAKPLNYGAPP